MTGNSGVAGTVAPARANTTVAVDFFKKFFRHTTHSIWLCSLANERDDENTGPEDHIRTRDGDQIAKFLTEWNEPLRSTYFCVGTVEGTKRNKTSIRELACLWADIDFKHVVDDEATIVRRLTQLRFPPSMIIKSGHGLHCYWFLKEPMSADEVDRVEAAVKLLCDLVGADQQVTQIAALMRVPGSVNSKACKNGGDAVPVTIIYQNDFTYELDDIEEMLSETSPIVLRKERERARTVGETKFFADYAERHGYQPPVDVEARLNGMMYMGNEDASVHGTQISVTASLLNAGMPIDEVVALVLEATRAAAGVAGTRWNWRREEKAVRGMCATWIKKHPPGENKKASVTIVKPVDIDWTKVDEHAGWLKTITNLPQNFSTKGKIIIGHKGSISDLNIDLRRNGVVVNKPINNLADVAFNVAMVLRADGRLTIEQVAAALLCPLPCNQHVTKQPDDQKRNTIERLMWRTREQRAQQQSVKRTVTGEPAEPGEPDWRERRENGSPLPSMHNARLGVNALGIECSYDTFHNKLLFGFAGDVKHEVQSLLGEVSDNGIMALRQLMSTRFKFDLTEKHIRDAVVSLALEHCFDPVLDLIDKAEADWDGVERLDKMVATHFNCEDTPLNRAFIRKTMIALVARARNPGCKFDTITVLESPEGQNKSTAWKVLAGDENFSDEAIIGKGSREVQEQLAGVWIHENAELAGMKKADVDAVKAYASRTTDRARAAYGHFPIWQKRHSIDVGTTNSDEYLQSQTGNRRFWPLKLLGPIDEVLLRLDRLQLIGEAAHYQTAGESITLDASMWAAAGVQQEKRRVKDPWEAVLSSMPPVVEIDGGYQGNTTMHTIIDFVEGQERVASADVLTYVLGIAVGHQNRGHTMRLSDVMKQLGWQRDEDGNKITVNGKQTRGYFRVVDAVPGPVPVADKSQDPRF
jgi:hypothetical protein